MITYYLNNWKNDDVISDWGATIDVSYKVLIQFRSRISFPRVTSPAVLFAWLFCVPGYILANKIGTTFIK